MTQRKCTIFTFLTTTQKMKRSYTSFGKIQYIICSERRLGEPTPLLTKYTIDLLSRVNKPAGLMNILQEMKLRKELIDKDELLDETYYSEAGWVTKQFSKLYSWFSSPVPEAIDPNKEFVSAVWLENSCKSLVDWALSQSKEVFSIEEIKSLLRNSGKSTEDIKIIMTHMQRTDRMKVDGCIKIGEKGEVDEITNTEKVHFKLINLSEDLDIKMDSLRDKIDQAREKAKLALKNSNRDKATIYMRECKALEKTETTLRGMKMKVDEQVMTINMSHSTK